MEDSTLMAIGEAAKQLKEKQPDVPVIETAGMALHVLREIRVLIRWDKFVSDGSERDPKWGFELTTYSNTKVSVSLVCTIS